LFVVLITHHPPASPLFPYTPLFRSLNVFGEPIDGLPPVEADERWSIHRYRHKRPDSFRITTGEGRVFETGIKAIDLLAPLERGRSEEHTSELQSRENLVCRLLLEKK